MRALFLHLADDALVWIGVVIAGVAILTTGWLYADPLVSVLIGVLILGSAWGVLRDAPPSRTGAPSLTSSGFG